MGYFSISVLIIPSVPYRLSLWFMLKYIINVASLVFWENNNNLMTKIRGPHHRLITNVQTNILSKRVNSSSVCCWFLSGTQGMYLISVILNCFNIKMPVYTQIKQPLCVQTLYRIANRRPVEKCKPVNVYRRFTDDLTRRWYSLRIGCLLVWGKSTSPSGATTRLSFT